MTDYDSDALHGLDSWFGRILQGLSPGKRRGALLKLGQALRRSNLARIKDNVEPDGGAMEERKSRLDRRGRVRAKAGGTMFKRLRYARRWQITARPDSVEMAPKGKARIPAEHHFGLRGYVGRGPDGRKIYTRYPARRLLGFGREDDKAAIDIAAELFDTPP
ncbi:phage virion morphogenesis protein [Erythrobacter sp. EC-HK427]|uniref:phage virion morphogenesis protein n=1 Tax=Erythrobacter sp. EC-HK427 TaxID=2038396 RepID=UPI001254EDAF|nr:phage virion morphogenesis protein [Erythrobacter sp. EC-HK427]VVT07432.1 Phage tail completion protein [Erythrobacter sp. EC-HK427]